MSKCELCALAAGNIITFLYHEDDTCIIVDCKTCGVPMVVLKAHRKPIKNELEHMMNKARELFDLDRYTFDFTMRAIKDHFHFHLRDFNLHRFKY